MGAVGGAGDALGGWTYPFMGAMAFLETAIPPVTLVFPGEWAVMSAARWRQGQMAIVPLMRSSGPSRPPVTRSRSARATPGRPFLRPMAAASASPSPGSTSSTLARPLRLAGGCLGRLVPLARPFGPLVQARRIRPTGSCIGTCLGTLLSRSLLRVGYVF